MHTIKRVNNNIIKQKHHVHAQHYSTHKPAGLHDCLQCPQGLCIETSLTGYAFANFAQKIVN